jgi:hypothetical protein
MTDYPATIQATLNSLCRSVISGNLSIPFAQATFVGMVSRARAILDEPYDLNIAADDFLVRLNQIAAEREAKESLIRAYAAKALAHGAGPDFILSTALSEAKDVLSSMEVREILRDEWRKARPVAVAA